MNWKRAVPTLLLLSGWTVAGWADIVSPDIIPAPRLDSVQARVAAWISSRKVTDQDQLAEVDHLWQDMSGNSQGTRPSGNGDQLLERVLQTFAVVHPPTADAMQQMTLPATTALAPDFRSLLNEKSLGEFYQANFRLYLGKYLVHREMYDEALETLTAVAPTDTVDPSACLFYRAACEKALGMKEAGLLTLEQLLKRTEGVPTRYQSVATLMQYDLNALEEKSLDDISNKMADVRRRLNLARPGKKTQEVEKKIVDLLDEMIKNMEDQANGGGGGGGGSSSGRLGKGGQGATPAGDSRVKGETAPGEVDKKKLKPGANWGNLDDKERAKVKNLISRDFPAHYRQAIEEYFKKLATRDSK